MKSAVASVLPSEGGDGSFIFYLLTAFRRKAAENQS